MNNDLISREALKKALKSNCDTLCNDKNTSWCEHCCPLNDFEDLIDDAPTVEERPTGEWIDRHKENRGNVCSFCNESLPCTDEYDYQTNYCPNCGAKMGKEKKND